MAKPRWTDRETDGSYWDLLHNRKVVASVAFSEETRRWHWYVHMPPGWNYERNPCGVAKSCDAAKAVCDAIIAGTIEE
jgi:hypothetical protein